MADGADPDRWSFSSPALIRLAAWSAPGFPIGAFAWSHGLEAAIAAGAVRDGPGLSDWTADLLAHGAGRTDAILAAHAAHAAQATRAARAGAEGEPTAALTELALALAISEERRAESLALGQAFARMVREGWGATVCDGPYPIAYGTAVGAAALPLRPALALMIQGVAAMVVSAGVRLLPLGQTEGQRILAGLSAQAIALAEIAAEAPLDAVGGAAFAGDIAAMVHETQDPRLFRS